MNKHFSSEHVLTEGCSRKDGNDVGLSTRIGRTYRFESAHHLPNLPEGHKCKNLHGHNYRMEVVVRGKVDGRGFVRDFAEMDAEVGPLLKLVDHRLLNDVEGLENPTAEIIAGWFFERIPDCESVRIYENDDCWAEVRAEESGPGPQFARVSRAAGS